MSRLLITIRGRRNQTQAAALAGLTQVRVSRLERGEGPPLTLEEARDYAHALGATVDQAVRLIDLAEERAENPPPPRAVILTNAPAIQRRIREHLTAADVVRNWTTDTIPGFLQTPEWTRAMQAGEGEGDMGEEWHAERQGQAALLDDPDRHWHVLVSEAALRWIVGSRAAQARQIRHIAELSRRPNLRLGVIDLATPKPFTAAYGFQIFGTTVAEVDTDLGATFRNHPPDVAYYLERFERLAEIAVYDDEARALLERIARTLGR